MDISPETWNTQDTIDISNDAQEEGRIDTLVLLRRGNKIPTEGDPETKCRAETEEKTIQRLLHLVIYPIYSYKTYILDTYKYLLSGAGYSCHLGCYACT